MGGVFDSRCIGGGFAEEEGLEVMLDPDDHPFLNVGSHRDVLFCEDVSLDDDGCPFSIL